MDYFMKSTVLAIEINLGHQNMAYISLTTSITISPKLIMLESLPFLFITIQKTKQNKNKINPTLRYLIIVPVRLLISTIQNKNQLSIIISFGNRNRGIH